SLTALPLRRVRPAPRPLSCPFRSRVPAAGRSSGPGPSGPARRSSALTAASRPAFRRSRHRPPHARAPEMAESALQPAPDSSRLSQVRHWLSRHPEAVAFWVLALAHLIPVWAFHYLPTQDGPSHLANAYILKDYGTPGSSYATFFEL